MKIYIILFFLLCGFCAKAQMRFTMPVQEADSTLSLDSSTFRHHPIVLEIQVNQKDFETYSITATTIYFEKLNNPYYKSKDTRTTSFLELPSSMFDLKSAVNADGTYNIPQLNAILVLFGLKYRP